MGIFKAIDSAVKTFGETFLNLPEYTGAAKEWHDAVDRCRAIENGEIETYPSSYYDVNDTNKETNGKQDLITLKDKDKDKDETINSFMGLLLMFIVPLCTVLGLFAFAIWIKSL